MLTIFLPIIKRKISLEEINEIVDQIIKNEDIYVLIMCEKNHKFARANFKKFNNFYIDVYPVGTSEESMLSESIKSCPATNALVIRDSCKFLSAHLINKLLDQKEDADIAMLKKQKKSNKIKKYFTKILTKISKLFFGFTFFNGDNGMQYFSTKVFEILQETNTALMTKINRFVMMKIKYVDAEFSETNLAPKIPPKFLCKFLIYPLVFAFTICLLIFLPKLVNITTLVILLIICAIIVEIILFLYAMLEFYCYKRVGAIFAPHASLIERRNHEKN